MPLIKESKPTGDKAVWKTIDEETGKERSLTEADIHATEITKLFGADRQVKLWTAVKKKLAEELVDSLTASVTVAEGKIELSSNPDKIEFDEEAFRKAYPEKDYPDYYITTVDPDILDSFKKKLKRADDADEAKLFPFFKFTKGVGKILRVKPTKSLDTSDLDETRLQKIEI